MSGQQYLEGGCGCGFQTVHATFCRRGESEERCRFLVLLGGEWDLQSVLQSALPFQRYRLSNDRGRVGRILSGGYGSSFYSVLLLSLLGYSAQGAEISIRVTATRRQTFQGFGTSHLSSERTSYASLPQSTRDELARLMWSDEGAGFRRATPA